jgi:aspartate aminotransferase-like enzyme
VTAAKLPEGHDWKTFNGAIKGHGVVLAGGQGKLTGKIFRLGHLGSVTVEEILGTIAVLETVTLEQGRRITAGAAVGAAFAAAADALGLGAAAGDPARAQPEAGVPA